MKPGIAISLIAFALLAGACGDESEGDVAEARKLLEAGRAVEARQLALRVLSSEPEGEGLRLRLAELLLDVDEPGKAAEALEGATGTEAREVLAYAQLRGLDRAAAGKTIEGLFSDGNASARAHRLRGLWLLPRDMRAAVKELREAHRLDPDDPLNWAFLGSGLVAAGNVAEAEDLLRRGCARFRESPEVGRVRAELLLELRPKDPTALREVVELLRVVEEKRPLDRASRLRLAVALRRLKRYTEAEQVAERLVREGPDDALAWSELGLARGFRGKVGEAVEALERAVELAPTDVDILKNLGNAYLEQVDVVKEWEGPAREAFRVYERARSLAARDPDVFVGLGRSMVKLDPGGRIDPEAGKAFGFYRMALEIDPAHFAANLNIALLYYDLWNQDRKSRGSGYLKALEHFEKAAAVVPPENTEEWDRNARKAYEELRQR